MFDSVLGRGQGPRSRVVPGVVLSVVLHVVVLVLVVWFSTRSPQEDVVEVAFEEFVAPPPPPPPALKSPSLAHRKAPTRKPVVKKPDVSAHSREPAHENPPEEAPDPNAREEVTEGEEGGVEGGVPGGVIGGVVGGVIGGQLGGTGTDVLPFGAGMTRPEKLSGPVPQYTREALEARVQGLMIVKCVITTKGNVERCRIVKPLPYMERAVLNALYATHYRPVTLQGRPIEVDYTFNIRLSLPP